jgi:Domain of unknown function (DUF222)
MFDPAGCDQAAMEPRATADLRELVDRCRKAAHEDLSLAGDDELRDVVVQVERARAALEAVEGHALGVLERRGSCDADLGMATASWLAWATHRSRRACCSRVRTGDALARLDALDAALSEGDLDLDHAEVIGRALHNPRVTDQVVANHHELVSLARRLPFELWRRTVDELVRLWDQDGAFDPDRERARNRVSFRQVGDVTILRGELVGAVAVLARQAIETMADKLWRRAQVDQRQTPDLPVPTRPTLRALALAELCRQGVAADGRATSAPVVDVTLVYRAAEPDAIRTFDRERLEPAGIGHLFCDAVRRLLTVDDKGQPLHLGRAVRHATPAQRRALAARDGGCVFPGCDRPASWSDAHHVPAWDEGGHTDIEHLALLCRHHHGVTHRTGWAMVTQPDQTFSWTTPSGHRLHSQRQHAPP